MKKERKQSNVLLWTKILHKLAIFNYLSPQKLGLLLVIASCILQSRTSCLYKASEKIKSVVGIANPKGIEYQTFIKFFATGKGDLIQKAILQLTLLFLFHTCTNCHLVLDRTNWEYGKTHKNILCIGAIYHGCFIPLVWIDLNKAGNSKMQVRLELIQRLKSQWVEVLPFPALHLSGDREFIGDFWLRQLVKLEIDFVIRIKKNKKCQVWFNDGIKNREVKMKTLHRYMAKKGLKSIEIVLAGDYIAQLIIIENSSPKPDEPFLYLITNINDVLKATQLYRMRWKIECCFKHLKTNGFNLEKQAFTAPHKIELLLSLLVWVYAMAIYEGIIIHQSPKTKPKIKNYKVLDNMGEIRLVYYPAISVFRAGLAHLENTICNVFKLIRYIYKLLKPYWPVNQHFIS
jgi:Transposase DDE domain